ARDERGLDRRRPGEHRHGQSRRDRRVDQPSAWIVDTGQPRIGDERDPFTSVEARQSLAHARRLVMSVVAGEPRADPVTVEEDPGSPLVLAEDEIGLAELDEDTQANVVEVPERSG